MKLHRVIAAQLCLALSGEALAQAPALRGPAISGRVIDAFDGRPLAHAIVEVIPRDSSTPLRRQSAESGSDGVYVIRGLERATFRLVIRKLGYRPSTITVTIVDSLNSEVSIGLEVAPVLLQPTRIVSERQRDFMLLAATDSIRATTRLDETRTRRNHFLGTDVREITAADVVEGVTLGEPDLFRSLHRLPGVTAAEDYSAEFWTRGARWDLTRIGFDGLPLYGPLHGFGLVSVLPMDVVGSATFFPGISPLGSPEGAAGVLDLRSRAGTPGATTRGSAELSLLGVRATVVGAADDGSTAWMLSGRRSYLDLASRAAGAFTDDDVQVPFYFGDVVGRYERQLGPSTGSSLACSSRGTESPTTSPTSCRDSASITAT